MMNSPDSTAKQALRILRDALDVANGGERDAFVRERCGADTPLLARVTSLLRGAGEADGEAADPPAATDPLVGAALGPFRVVERIGRGGMGVVYRGRREGADFAQDVAIKLIRRGFDFDDVHARFLRERRILARLEHPHLARFIDGGVAPDGRPWFALEFVRGEPVTRWCDERGLDIRSRVRLFLDVCAAVQHAHTQLVVHRDLKPANILVDGEGRVKLLDFGIAKLLGDDEEPGASPTTIGPRHALTPEYAAPEQFGGGSAGVATDVYCLGVILYELLTGVLPYELDRTDLAAAERIVRETPPQAPLAALARDCAATGGADARLRSRGTTRSGYRQLLRGDLAHILDKLLAKEPARRYATVQAFADDLVRWLDGLPVRVSGNAFGYRMRKFVARNRIAIGFAMLAGLAIVAGLAATIWQTREARIQRDDALAAAKRSDAMRGYLMLMFRDAAGQKDATKVNVREVFKSGAERLFDEFRDDPLAGQTAALMLSDLFIQLGDVEGGTPLLERLLQWPGIEANPDVQANARYNLAQIEIVRGNAARARALLDQAQAWWTGRPGSARAILNESRSTQARIERAEGKVDAAIATLHDAIAERRALLGKDDFMVGNLFNTLSNALTQAGHYEDAVARADDSHRVFERLGRADSDGGMAALNSRGNANLMMGRPAQALPDYLRVVEMTRALYGGTSKLAASLNNAGVALTRLGRNDEALPNLEEALRLAASQSGERSPLAVTARVSLAELYARVGRAAEASSLAESAMEITQADYPANRILLATTHRARAEARLAGGRPREARADLEQATTLFAAAGRSGEAYIRLMAPLRHALEVK